MFEVNNKDTNDVIASIVNFEQVNAAWVVTSKAGTFKTSLLSFHEWQISLRGYTRARDYSY